MLKLKDVKKSYSDFTLECSLEVLPGRITGIIGQNGAGKSTVFKAILGLINIDGGSIELFGQNAADVAKKAGVVLADSGFSGYLTAEDAAKILKSFYPDFQEQFFINKCKEMAIPMKKQIKEFSTGMKAKLKVIAAISHNAPFLILDEPTVGLDIIARDETLSMIREYMEADESRFVLISSHISADLESLCDDLYMISGGKIIFHEDTDVLLSDYAVLKTSEEEYKKLDGRYLLRVKKERFGYSALTNEKKFFVENYPNLVVENSSIDEFIEMMALGEAV